MWRWFPEPITVSRPKALISWSSGKDSAWALHTVMKDGTVDVVGLLTTFNSTFDRVSMQGVRRDLVQAQAQRLGIPLWPVELSWPCPNDEYERRMGEVLVRAETEGITRVVFGDLFLEDVRAYREDRMAGTGVEPVFPIWCGRAETADLARRMVEAGTRAVITSVDPAQLDTSFAGRVFDSELLDELPAGVDPLGENGEFHTFCYAGPLFEPPIGIRLGETVERDGFIFNDVIAVV